MLTFAVVFDTIDALSDEMSSNFLNYPSYLMTGLFLLKFFIGVAIYKLMKKGNSSKITRPLFYSRVIIDLLIIIPSIVYLHLFSTFNLWHVLNYSLPLVLCEPLIYFWSVKDAARRESIKKSRNTELGENLVSQKD